METDEDELKISIIGTSGRNNDPATHKLTSYIFDKMVTAVEEIINSKSIPKDRITLVSGGAPWVDHVAVTLFLKGGYKGLLLYIPCAFDDNKYRDTGSVDYISNPGGTLNYYFKKFSEKMGRNMLLDVKQAINLGAILNTESKGFKSRNTMVSKSNIVIALTWGNKSPESGGTGDTWRKVHATSQKVHISLDTLL